MSAAINPRLKAELDAILADERRTLTAAESAACVAAWLARRPLSQADIDRGGPPLPLGMAGSLMYGMEDGPAPEPPSARRVYAALVLTILLMLAAILVGRATGVIR